MDQEESSQGEREGERRARRNALVLAIAQGLYFIGATILISLGALTGHLLAQDKSLATLPVTAYVVGTLVATIPASHMMRHLGRRTGFQIGALFAVAGTSLAVHAIFERAFWLFCAATLLLGAYQACAQYYRFAAADTASEAFKPKAISWVLAGGLVAALIAPQIVIYTKDAFAPVLFAGSFAAAGVAALLAIGVLAFLDIPRLPAQQAGGRQSRPLLEILRQPRLRIAILTGMVSYASMTFVMTATPLAMVACNHSVDSATLAIQWHVVAMFAPSFFTGHLIARFGREMVILTGLLMLGAAGLVALSGLSAVHFTLALVLLGVGWNFGYIGSTTMVTDCHRPEERNKVQALNEFMVFSLVASASFASGYVLHNRGWEVVAFVYLPFVALAAGLVLMLHLGARRSVAAG
ncbi:MAG: MFS transporter [Methyloligellaceae bacterium]